MKPLHIILAICLVMCFAISCSHEPEEKELTPAELFAPIIEELNKTQQEYYENLNEVIALRLELEKRIDELENPIPHEVIIQEVEKMVVVHKELPIKLTDWQSADELRDFLESDNTSEVVRLVASDNGTILLNGQCEDRAIQLIDGAMEKGKRLFFVPLHPAEYLKWYDETLGEGHYHAICGALIGDNEFWYIEPSDDRCWLALYLD